VGQQHTKHGPPCAIQRPRNPSMKYNVVKG
jgi:hypothetical protein